MSDDGNLVPEAISSAVSNAIQNAYGSYLASTAMPSWLDGRTPAERRAAIEKGQRRILARREYNKDLSEVLAACEEPLLLEIISLHVPDRLEGSYPVCCGCDYAGYESEPPEWPCRTVDALARALGIEPFGG